MTARTLDEAQAAAAPAQWQADAARRGAEAATRQLLSHCAELDAPSTHRVAAALLQQRFAAPAAALLDAAVQRFAESAPLQALRGHALRLLGQADAAEASLRTALHLAPQQLDSAVSLAFLLREQGRLAAAATVLVDAWRAQPPRRDTDARTLGFLREMQQVEAAAEVATVAVERWPEDAMLLAAAGELCLEQGEFARARSLLAQATAREPSRGASWLRLAHTHRFSAADDADLVAMRAAQATQTGEDAQICLGFALGKACNDLGDHAGAAQAWRAANARARAAQAWNAAAWAGFVEARRRAAPLPGARAADAGFAPLFVVGLPRTGTTLVSALLARDARVRNRGETNWLAALAARLPAQPDADALAAAAALFRAQLRQDDAPAVWYLDKNPLNLRHLDLAFALFPQARAIHCVRDSRDTALSIWSQHFAHPDMAWSYDFADIAAVAQGSARLMETWQARYGERIARVRYEDLVADSEGELARLRALLGLRGEAPTASAPAPSIRTASVWQARQAVHAGSVGRWRAYAAYLPELAALQAD